MAAVHQHLCSATARVGKYGFRQRTFPASPLACRDQLTKRSFQNDHVFLTPRLSSELRQVSVWNEPGRRVSDHDGILIDLDVPTRSGAPDP
jgi:endonuclease/exonuclease/phosphatase family metal-dependent hydrolase